MRHVHSHTVLSTMSKQLTQKDDIHFVSWIEVNSVLGKFWSEQFSSSEYLVLLFVINRTLLFRKKAEMITGNQFANGITSGAGVTCAGAGVARNTLKAVLNALCERDYLHVHCFKEGLVEATPRIYEVNCQKILEGYDLEETQNMLKRSRRAMAEAQENSDFDPDLGGSDFGRGGGSNLGHITELLHSSNSSSLKEEDPSREEQSKGHSLRVGKRRLKPSAIDCTEKPTTIPATAQAALERMKSTSNAKKATRLQAAHSLPDRRWEIRDLQAALDEARDQCGVSVPRVMATTKGAGVLFKRMKEAEVKDALEFFIWTLRNWGRVANANRRSKAKQLKEQKKVGTEMSLIPNFQDLAYRCPYIMAFFNERHYTERQEVEQKASKDSAEKRVLDEQNTAIERRRAYVREQDIRQREQDREAEQRFTERRRRPRIEDQDEEALPEFKPRQWKGTK